MITTNLEYYKVFYYVASLGGLTAAANQLNISQPAVSQAMKQLELSLGTKLCARTAKGVKLTREGEVLYTYCKTAYEQLELGESKLRQMLDLEMGEIRIGASDMTLQFFLLPFLEVFHEKYPGIKVTVTNAPTPETIRNLEDGMIDFGVISSPYQEKENLSFQAVKEIEDIFIAGRKFIQYKHRTLDFQELEKLPLIVLEGHTSSRSCMEEFLRKNSVEIQPEFELATSDMIVQFALRNLGIGNVMREFATQYLEEGKLFELRFNKRIPKRQICIVKNNKLPLSTPGEKLLNLIISSAYESDK